MLVTVESPWKHSSRCVHEGVSREVQLRREDPEHEYGQYHSTGKGFGLNEMETIHLLLSLVVPTIMDHILSKYEPA